MKERHFDDPVAQEVYDQPWFHPNTELGDIFDELVEYVKTKMESA